MFGKEVKEEKKEEVNKNVEKKQRDLGSSIILAAIIIGISILIGNLLIYKGLREINISSSSNVDQFKMQLQTLPKVDFPSITEYDPTYGNGDKAIIFEYTDYQCPFCARHTIYTFPEIKKNYIDTGIIKYVYKSFPLKMIHPYAIISDKYAICTYKLYGLDTYTKFKEYLFENQTYWANSNVTKIFNEYLTNLGLDINKIESCVNSTEVENSITNDLKEVEKFRFTGTPSFAIAIRTDLLDSSKLNELTSIASDLQGKVFVTKDLKYVIIAFSGAFPYQYFDQILSLAK